MSLQPIPDEIPQQSRVNRIVSKMPPSGIRVFFDLVADTPGVISLGVGEPDFVTPWHVCEAGIHALETGWTAYTSNQGRPELLDALSDYLYETRKYRYNPRTQLLATVGGSEAIDLAFRALLDPGDEVILVEPAFVSYAPLVVLAGGVPVIVQAEESDGFLPPIDKIENAISSRTKMLLINYPNNPTGAALTHDVRRELEKIVLHHGLILVSDELYTPLTYEREPVSMLDGGALADQLLLVHGFSKAWAMTGWRLGFVAGPKDLIEGLSRVHQYGLMCAPTVSQCAAIEAIRRGHKDVEEMRKEYDRRRRFIVSRFEEIGFPISRPYGAFYVFPRVDGTGMDGEMFARRLLEREKVAVVPGSAFGSASGAFVRCSYATAMDDIKAAMEKIEAFTASL